MDWTAVKKDTPKAFERFVKWIDTESDDILQFELMMILKNERDLYDFFDDQKIIIDIQYELMDINGIDKFMFVPSAVIISLKERIGKSQYGKRKQAENAIFTEAFKILENQLC